MQIGFVGLGRMGANMVLRLLERGRHEVVTYDPVPEAAALVARGGATMAGSLDEVVATLRPPRAVWVMVPVGEPVETTLGALVELCAPGDLVVDGGNSYYKDSMRRAVEIAGRGMELLDVGTSGGLWGREHGYALMVGGSAEGFARLEPVFHALAANGGYAHVGPSGAGHFAKMVHNGIEYALMQAYAEGFAILEGAAYAFDLGKVAELWTRGSVIRSWLLELLADALAQDPNLERVAGYVEDTGYGRWTVQAAIEEAVAAPAIAQALFARFRSRQQDAFSDRVLAVLRQQFGGHIVRPPAGAQPPALGE